jgi:hypothetical protein
MGEARASAVGRRQVGRKGRWLLLSVSLLLALLLIEGLCRAYRWLWPSVGYVSRWEFRAQRPPPYHDADYFSQAFLLESMQCVGLRTPPNTRYLVQTDFQGQSIRVSDQRRHTTHAPTGAVNRVLLFGGSTMFSGEVPDEWTIASCLQRRLNKRPGPPVAVENYGTCSVLARQQTERLLATPIQPGDIVIFYDGVNDVYYPIYNGNPTGWQPGDGHDGGVRRLSWLQRTLYPLCFRCQHFSAAANLLFKRLEACPPKTVASPKTLARNLDAAEIGYARALTDARKTVALQRGQFFHFLQPNIFTLSHPSHYERRTIQNELLLLPKLDMAFEFGYPRLRKALDDAAKQDVVSIDLSDALNDRQPRQQFYLDFCHVNHLANERVAGLIFDHVFGKASSHP